MTEQLSTYLVKNILPSSSKFNSLEGVMLKLKLQHFGHLMQRADSFEKTLRLGKIEGRRRRGRWENKMVGWHHWLDGYVFEQAPGDGDGQGSLACCSPWGRKVRHAWATERHWTRGCRRADSPMTASPRLSSPSPQCYPQPPATAPGVLMYAALSRQV